MSYTIVVKNYSLIPNFYVKRIYYSISVINLSFATWERDKKKRNKKIIYKTWDRRERNSFIHYYYLCSLLLNDLWNISRRFTWLYQARNCLLLQSPVCREQNRATSHFHWDDGRIRFRTNNQIYHKNARETTYCVMRKVKRTILWSNKRDVCESFNRN